MTGGNQDKHMEKERAIQCVPSELLARFKALAERLWAENNPSAVHINAILDEFGPDIKALGHVVSEYEADCASRLAIRDEEHARAEARIKEEVQALKHSIAALEVENAAVLEKTAGLKAEIRAGEARQDELKAKAIETERELNLKFVAKTQELYDQLNKKDLEMLAKWEEKNRKLEARAQAMEEENAGRAGRFEARENELEAEALARKVEFMKVFDRISGELAAREKALIAQERSLAYWAKTNIRKEGEGQ